MHKDTPQLTDREVLDYARTQLHDHLPLQADGYVCTTDDLLNVLLGVAVNRGTLEAVCADLVGTPTPETLRRYLNEQLRVEELSDLEQRLNAALAQQVPARVRRAARDVALDFHDRPYYGTASQEAGLWVRGQAKDGTTHFYRVATAYVMWHELRVTLAIRFVRPSDDIVGVVAWLLARVVEVGLSIRHLFLDKGFASIEVMDYLTQRALPSVIACPIRGQRGGTRALCQGRKSYRTQHTFRGADQRAFTTELAVCRVFTTARRTKRLKRRATWLIFCLIHLDWSPHWARRAYRRRFGIESSYRCAAQVRGWTTSNNPVYRFVLIALSFFLLNVWLHLRWLFTQVKRRGRRWLDTSRFRLARLVKFILHALERRYGCVQAIVAPAVPRL